MQLHQHSMDPTAGSTDSNQPADVKARQDVFDMGIDVYNEECRKIVMRYALHHPVPSIAVPAQCLSVPVWARLR